MLVPGGGANLTHVCETRNLLILKSTESLKSTEATSLGTNWAQRAFEVSIRAVADRPFLVTRM